MVRLNPLHFGALVCSRLFERQRDNERLNPLHFGALVCSIVRETCSTYWS